MPRQRTDKPKRNLVSFRLNDDDFLLLRKFAEHAKHNGETFSETIGRAVKWFIQAEAERQIKALRETQGNVSPPVVSITTERLDHWHKDA